MSEGMNTSFPTQLKLKLYHYWRSSSSWRVRYALDLKKISYETVHVGLLNGESESKEHLSRNPAGQVPVLEIGPEQFLTESLPIIEFLEEQFPLNSIKLLPNHPVLRAQARALAEVINAGTQPIQNVPILEAVARVHGKSEEENKRASEAWAREHISMGLHVFQSLLTKTRADHKLEGPFCFGKTPSLPDVFLIPQIYNAVRYSVDLSPLQDLFEIYTHAQTTREFKTSEPSCFEPK